MHIGENIKSIRIAKDISIERLVNVLGVDIDYMQLIEEKKTEPPVSDLLKIAAALGTDIAALIYGKELEEKSAIVTRSDSRVYVERKKSLKYESLAPYYSGRHIEPFVLEVFPKNKDELEFSRHKGEEFHYVLEGQLRIIVDEKENILLSGDSIYFDSSLPHSVSAVSGTAKVIAMIYNSETMLKLTKSRHMRDLIQGAKLLKGQNIAIASPNESSIEAANRAIEEDVIEKVYFIGDKSSYPNELLIHKDRYIYINIDPADNNFDVETANAAVELVRNGKCHMLMKGRINTAIYLKAILNKETGISSDRKLSLVSIFELPNVDRLVFLTDAGINPELTHADDLKGARDIILNGIDAARGIGVAHPKVAILDANELPSTKIPSSMNAKELTKMKWENAEVFGPLSYDLALYEESVKHKRITKNPVAGKADILIVPTISGGNFLYKAWSKTMSADVANIVIGAKAPIILASRSDSDMTKFLTICACSVYSQYVLTKNKKGE